MAWLIWPCLARSVPPVIVKTLSLLLPALIPSWRFFKSVEPSPRIEVCVQSAAGWGDWRESHPRPAHLGLGAMLKRMLWNPQWNADLYLVSCAERMTAGYNAHSDAQIIAGVRRALAAQGAVQGAVQGADQGADQGAGQGAARGRQAFRYRLTFVGREGAQRVMFIEYESPPLPMAAAP